MRKNIFVSLVIVLTLFTGSCKKNESEPEKKTQDSTSLGLTPGQTHIRDSVINYYGTVKPAVTNLKAGLAVTVSATKLNCNTFRLTVTVNQQFCPRTNSPLVAYWTLFDSFGHQNLSPTYGNPCISGNQVTMNYTVKSTDYLYIVLLLFEPKTGIYDGVFISNTIVLTPSC